MLYVADGGVVMTPRSHCGGGRSPPAPIPAGSDPRRSVVAARGVVTVIGCIQRDNIPS